MWDTREEFRWSAQYVAQLLLEHFAAGLEPQLILIGFSENDRSDSAKTWMEPSDIDWLNAEELDIDTSKIAGIRKRITPLQTRIYGTKGVRVEDDNRNQLQAIRRLVIQSVIKKMRGGSRRLFTSLPFERDGEFLIALLAVNSSVLQMVPTIRQKIFHRKGNAVSLACSLVEAAINELLERIIASVRDSETEPLLDIRGSVGEVIQSAGRRFFSGAILRSDSESFFLGRSMTLYDTMERLSLASYEKNDANGMLLISEKFREPAKSHIYLDKQVSFSETRLIRKLLEVAGAKYAIGCTCKGGAAVWKTRYPDRDKGEHIASIEFTRRGKWTLAFDGIEMMSVIDGVPQMPKSSIVNEELLTDLAKRFSRKCLFNINLFAKVLVALEAAGHGSLLVVSHKAASEAKRLSADAIVIRPTLITAELAMNLSKVDGAILCSPEGLCFAFGVILDGVCVSSGDRGRGSRFNSANRYIASMKSDAAALVFSEDGGMDVLPQPDD